MWREPYQKGQVQCSAHCQGQGNPQYQYRLEMDGLGLEKDLGIPVDEKLDTSQQCVLAGQKNGHILAHLMKIVASSGVPHTRNSGAPHT